MTFRPMSLLHRTRLIVSVLASFAVTGAPISAVAETATPVQQAGPNIARVTVAPVIHADMIGQVSVSGTLVPREEILVYPQVSGSTIESLLFEIGDTVAQGDTLATLNNSTLIAQLAQARAELARADAGVRQARSQIASATANETQAQVVLERAQTLRENGSGTQAALDLAIANGQTSAAAAASALDGLAVAEAQRQQAQAQLDIASLNLDRATLRAPAAGLISARNGQVGAIAGSAGEPIFRIIRDGAIEVEAEVIETALGSIAVGDRAQMSIASNGEVAGTVRRISPTVDPRNRLGTIRIDLDQNDALRSGLFASGQIITVQRRTLAVPTAAVLTDADGTFVFVVVEGVLEKRPVQAGLIWNGLREVITGLTDADVVVARAGAFFGDGDTIKPVFPTVAAIEGVSQ